MLTTVDEPTGRGNALSGFTADAAGFDAFYHASARPVLRQLFVMCGDLEEARDCLQEGYARAWQRWDELAAYENPAAWVRTAAWRIAVSRWRRTQRLFRVSAVLSCDTDAFDLLPDLVSLSAALRRLPALQREAVVLHYLVGLSIREISDQIHAPPGTVKARLSRARAALAEYLGEGGVG